MEKVDEQILVATRWKQLYGLFCDVCSQFLEHFKSKYLSCELNIRNITAEGYRMYLNTL